MSPQLDKAATQPQLLQEWFLVSQPPELSNGAGIWMVLQWQCKSFHSWLCYCFADIKGYYFQKEGAHNPFCNLPGFI